MPTSSTRPREDAARRRWSRWDAAARAVPRTWNSAATDGGPLVDGADWDDLIGSYPPLPVLAALADDDAAIAGREPVRAWCARRFPLVSLTPLLRNPHAVAEILQWKVTFGADLADVADAEILRGSPFEGLPLSLSALERSWAARSSAWFASSAPDLRRGRASERDVPACRPAVLAGAAFYGSWQPSATSSTSSAAPWDVWEDFDDEGAGPSIPGRTDVARQLLALPGGGWVTGQLAVAVDGTSEDAAAALGAWVGTTARVTAGSGSSTLGAVLASVHGPGGVSEANALSSRVAVHDLMAQFGVAGDPVRSRVRAGVRWAHLQFGGCARGAGLTVSDARSRQSWAVAFTW